MEAKFVRVFSFYAPDGKSIVDMRGDVLRLMERLVRLAGEYGVVLCHENEGNIYGDIPERCLDLLGHFGGELKCVFDMGNFVLEGVDPYSAYEALKDYVAYFHVKDALANNVVVPAGHGIGNLPYLVGEYQKTPGASGVLTMEPHLYEFVGLSNLEQEGERTVIGGQFNYANNDEAFDAACDAIKAVIAGLE